MTVDWTRELSGQFDLQWNLAHGPSLETLTDEEYLWEPVPGCWSIRPTGPGGRGEIEQAWPDPDPAPVTTIAWRLSHLAVGVFGLRASHHFGDGSLTHDNAERPLTAKQGVTYFTEQARQWRSHIERLDEEGLARPVGEPEADLDAPMASLVLHVNREALHHLAEVSLLRDLYRATGGARVADRGRVPVVSQGRDGSGAMTTFRVAEAEIGEDLRPQLQALLQDSFDEYPSRTYFKLPPHFRYLAMADGKLAAQMGVELRVIRVGADVLRTFGVVDLCVSQRERSRGLAGRLLVELTEYARSCAMDFIILFADDSRLYDRNGWARAANPCTWLKINGHRTLGLAIAQDTDALMVKAIGERAWPEGDVDLLGHLF